MVIFVQVSLKHGGPGRCRRSVSLVCTARLGRGGVYVAFKTCVTHLMAFRASSGSGLCQKFGPEL